MEVVDKARVQTVMVYTVLESIAEGFFKECHEGWRNFIFPSRSNHEFQNECSGSVRCKIIPPIFAKFTVRLSCNPVLVAMTGPIIRLKDCSYLGPEENIYLLEEFYLLREGSSTKANHVARKMQEVVMEPISIDYVFNVLVYGRLVILTGGPPTFFFLESIDKAERSVASNDGGKNYSGEHLRFKVCFWL